MIEIKQLSQWNQTDIYQEYVKHLLALNPLVEEVVEERRKDRPTHKIKRKVYVSGYWTRFCKKTNMANRWVYTKKIVDGRHRVVEVMSFARFQQVLDSYFIKAKECIIAGEGLKFGNGLGCIQGMHIERNHENRVINWHETKKQKLIDMEDGTKSYERLIYFMEDSYIRIGWVRANKLRNEQTYRFDPSKEKRKGGRGFLDMFVSANMANPNLKLQYPFYPYLYKNIS